MNPAPSSVEVVVARCGEDVRWTNNLPAAARVTLYDKSLHPVEGVQRLPNIGREAHTYLHHIVTRYDSLAPWTVFCQGHPFDHAPDLSRRVREWCDKGAPHGFVWLGFILDTDDGEGSLLFQNWSKNPAREPLHLARFYREIFGQEAPLLYPFFPGGQFAVDAATICTRTVEFYRAALEMAVSFPYGAHCFERLWGTVFGDPDHAARLLGGERCRYLKQVKKHGVVADKYDSQRLA